MAMDQELQRHVETWHGFTNFMKWGLGLVVLILVGMAFFLL